jgi:glycosidase
VAFPSPEDWRDVWIYFLLVDRFRNDKGPPRQPPWDGVYGGFQGGTLAGVRASLDYLRDLGAGAIWLSPVFRNPQWDEGAYHGYGIQDFLSVDPRFGTADDLHTLVEDAHALGLYVILDIVLNHTGDLFEYEGFGGVAPWRDDPYPILWRDDAGHGVSPDPLPSSVSPEALRANARFRRRGNAFTRSDPETGGDFYTLRELVTAETDVRQALIAAYQHAIAAFDVDGFRIDTLKFVEPDFALLFGNAIREFALSIGKRNFFTFGEVYDNEEKIAGFVGRHVDAAGDLVGVDAALDFPLFFRLPGVAKGFMAPQALVEVYQHRKVVERDVISSHGEASRFFVTFLDNHDQHSRFGHVGDPRFADQATLGLVVLFCLQGIPCLYYGTEQGLTGAGTAPEAVREALWGKPDAWSHDSPLARLVEALGRVRAERPALRYGRQYFRPISGDAASFGVSEFQPGLIAFSRILAGEEVVVVANASADHAWKGLVIVDQVINSEGSSFAVAAGNKPAPVQPEPVRLIEVATVHEVDGSTGNGPLTALPVKLSPLEAQVLARR